MRNVIQFVPYQAHGPDNVSLAIFNGKNIQLLVLEYERLLICKELYSERIVASKGMKKSCLT